MNEQDTHLCANCENPECRLFTYPHFDEGESKPYTDWLCDSCAQEIGFCPGCGVFGDGNEDFNLSLKRDGICNQCAEELAAEMDDYLDTDHDIFPEELPNDQRGSWYDCADGPEVGR